MRKDSSIKTALLAAAVLAGALMTQASAQQTIKIGVNQPLTGPVAASGNLRRERRADRRRRDQREGRRARPEDRARHRGQQEQPDRSRRRRREADRARQGAGDDGRVELDLHARRHAQADGIQGADAGRDLVLRQDHDLGQSVRLPHLADLGHGSGSRSPTASPRSRSGRPTSSSSTTTGAKARPTCSRRCSRSKGVAIGVVETMDAAAQDMNAQLAKIRSSDADTLFVTTAVEQLTLVLRQAHALGLKTPDHHDRRLAVARPVDRAGGRGRERQLPPRSSSRRGSRKPRPTRRSRKRSSPNGASAATPSPA